MCTRFVHSISLILLLTLSVDPLAAAAESVSEGGTVELEGEVIVGEEETPENADSSGEDGVIILGEREKGDEYIILRSTGRGGGRGIEVGGLRSSRDRVLWGQSLHIGRDEVVEGAAVVIGGSITVDGNVEGDCVAVGGGIDVRGRVSGSVVAIGGSARLDPAAVCESDVVAIGGSVEQNGAAVEGEIVSVGFLPWRGPFLPIANILLLLVVISFATFMLVTVIAGSALRRNALRMVTEVAERPFRSFWMGLGIHLLSQVAIFILTITLIGAPLAFLGAVLWWLVTQLGQVLAATRLGQLILRRPPHDEGLILSGIIGGLIVHGFLLFAVLLYNASGLAALTVGTIGIGFQLVLICIGTGALFSSRFGEDPEKRQARGSDKGPLFQPAAPGGETR